MAQEPVVTDVNLYKLKTAADLLSLQVVIGDGQVGATSLTLNGLPLPMNNELGTAGISGGSLSNSILRCVTIVHDTNTLTNNTSVTYKLDGGAEPRSFPYTFTVSQEKTAVHYVVSFIFVA